MILPKILGDLNISQNSFYIGCDSSYFDVYGIPLINSLITHAPWANIHVHLFNPTTSQIDWIKNKNKTCSYEFLDNSISEIKTYYACVRFIRVPEIFLPNTRVIGLDCDGIAITKIFKEKFLNDTTQSKVLWREKQQTGLASSVFFGPDDFRDRYAEKLKLFFKNDNFKWYLDQNIMDEMIKNKEVEITTINDWGWPKIKQGTLIWTGKGNRKHNLEFKNMLSKYR